MSTNSNRMAVLGTLVLPTKRFGAPRILRGREVSFSFCGERTVSLQAFDFTLFGKRLAPATMHSTNGHSPQQPQKPTIQCSLVGSGALPPPESC